MRSVPGTIRGDQNDGGEGIGPQCVLQGLWTEHFEYCELEYCEQLVSDITEPWQVMPALKEKPRQRGMDSDSVPRGEIPVSDE